MFGREVRGQRLGVTRENVFALTSYPFARLLLMSIALMGIIYRVEKRYVLIEPDGFLIILGYCLGLWLLFQGERCLP